MRSAWDEEFGEALLDLVLALGRLLVRLLRRLLAAL